MKVYIAAAYSRRPEAQAFANRIRDLGHTPVSTWLDGEPEDETSWSPALGESWARRDIQDMGAADFLVVMTSPRSTSIGGGYHWETGWFDHLKGPSRIKVVGPVSTVFHNRYDNYPTAEDFLAWAKFAWRGM